MKLPRKNPEQPKKPLGFQVVSNNGQGEDNV
jgi:hypothetical protein